MILPGFVIMLIKFLVLIWVWGELAFGCWYLPDGYDEEEGEEDFKTEPNRLVPASGIGISGLELAIDEYLKHKGELTHEILDDWPTISPNDLSQHTSTPFQASTDTTVSSNEAHVEFFTLKTESEETEGKSENPFNSNQFNPRRTLPLISELDIGETVETAETSITPQLIGSETFITDIPEYSQTIDLCEKFNMNLQDIRSRSYIPARPYWRNNGPVCKEDDFHVIKKIGKGAQGKVYLAVHQPSETRVALKYLTSATDRQRFPFIRMEECLQDRLNGHQHIAQHYCTFISKTKKPGLAVLALELVEEPVDMWDFVYLKKWDDAIGNFQHHFKYDENMVARLAAQMIGAMWYMHQMQVIYRDFKVENILIRPTGDICLLDFGLSSDPAKPCHLSHNKLLGTPYYFAPEYFKPGRPKFVAKEADWYALGITLYELAFRDGPFPQTAGISNQDLIGYVTKGFKCVSSQPKWASLCDLVNRLCEPDPKLRLGNIPGSYETFLLHPFLKGTGIGNLLREAEALAQSKILVTDGPLSEGTA